MKKPKADSALDILKEIRWKSQGRSYGMTEQTTSALEKLLQKHPSDTQAAAEISALRAQIDDLAEKNAENWSKWLDAETDKAKLRKELAALRADLASARQALESAKRLIDDAVEIMTPEQVGQWRGVRTWLEFDYPAAHPDPKP
jgi:predicted  nucleic acid-binding Zn-ribbon protein